MNNKLFRQLSIIVFYGALWGIVEASVGYLLHFLPALIAGTIMFPFASLILYRAYKASQNQWSLIGVGMIAIIIKSVNFFMPFNNAFKIINPMISILLESLVMMVIIKSLSSSKLTTKIMLLTFSSVLWRGLFIIYLGFQALTTGFIAVQISSLYEVTSFMIISGLLSAAMSVGVIYLSDLPKRAIKPLIPLTPVLSVITFGLAVILTILL